MAAAGLFAIENHIDRLAVDHYHASLLADSLSEIEELSIDDDPNRTNMVWVTLSQSYLTDLEPKLRENGILISMDDYPLRLVTHLDIDEDGIKAATKAFKNYFIRNKST